MSNTIIHIDLEAVDRRLRDGELWTTGWGDPYDTEYPTCLHGAILYCEQVPGDAAIIERVGKRFGFGVWANSLAASWAEVRSKVIPDITDDMLEVTFGPQWEHIVALIRRAATLKQWEQDHLLSAWKECDHIPVNEALNAADKASSTPRMQAVRATIDALWDASGVYDMATDCAGRALAVRDLIGLDGFTQEHYDTLVSPWVAVMGPVHPDDTKRAAKRLTNTASTNKDQKHRNAYKRQWRAKQKSSRRQKELENIVLTEIQKLKHQITELENAITNKNNHKTGTQ